MAFAQSSDFSGSANAFYWKETNYKDTIGEDDFVEKSQGSVPSFFGGLQRIPSIGKGTSFGFAVYSPDSDSKNQDDSIIKPELGVENFHRTITSQASTNYFSGGLATRLSSRFSVGFGLSLIKIDELSQTYQDTTQPTEMSGLKLVEGTPDRGKLFLDSTQNTKIIYEVTALEPLLGFQFVPFDSLVIGFTYRHPMIVQQNLELIADTSSVLRYEDYTPFNASEIGDDSSDGWKRLKESGYKVSKTTTHFGFSWFWQGQG